VAVHCCEDMGREAERICDRYPDRFNCPDCLVHHTPHLREYGLIVHDGGTSTIFITYCPWCGAKLPNSLREAIDA